MGGGIISLHNKGTNFFGQTILFASLVWLAATLDAVDRLKIGHKLRGLGDLTYGTYLWHIPVQITLMLWLKTHGISQKIANENWFFFVFFVPVILIAYLSFRFYELPMRIWLRKFAKR